MLRYSLQIQSLAILAVDLAKTGTINETDSLPLSLSSLLPGPLTLLTHTEKGWRKPGGERGRNGG